MPVGAAVAVHRDDDRLGLQPCPTSVTDGEAELDDAVLLLVRVIGGNSRPDAVAHQLEVLVPHRLRVRALRRRVFGQGHADADSSSRNREAGLSVRIAGLSSQAGLVGGDS